MLRNIANNDFLSQKKSHMENVFRASRAEPTNRQQVRHSRSAIPLLRTSFENNLNQILHIFLRAKIDTGDRSMFVDANANAVA